VVITGSLAHSYNICYLFQPNGIGTTKLTADASNFTVNSLQPGFTYIFTLQAVVGDGQMRVTSNAATFTASKSLNCL